MLATPYELDLTQVRTIRLASQGMATAPGTPAMAVVERCGFLRTLGGVEAYLAVRARQRTMRRAELDTCVGRGDVQVVPAVRGCIYLVARADVPLCLRIADQLSATRAQRDQEKAGLRPGEVEDTASAAFEALREHGPMTTDALRRTLPPAALRSLGDAGKRVGITSPLPPALRQLEFAGRIQRQPESGRLDTERYVWCVAARSPFADKRLPTDPERLHAQLLDRYVASAGVATLASFCQWSGLPMRAAKAALDHVVAVPVDVAEWEHEALASPHFEELLRQGPALASATAFLPFEDNLIHLFGGAAHLTDPEFHQLEVPSWGSGGGGRSGRSTLATAAHPSLRPLLADGRLCGFWEFDPDTMLAVPRCFRRPSRSAQLLIEDLSASISTFLRDELGHGHSFSIDTDDALRERLELLQGITSPAARAATKKVPARKTAGRKATGRKASGRTGTAKRAPARKTRPGNRR